MEFSIFSLHRALPLRIYLTGKSRLVIGDQMTEFVKIIIFCVCLVIFMIGFYAIRDGSSFYLYGVDVMSDKKTFEEI